ncbi:MAG: S-layer family protein [Leptolyngbya sp. SIO3F4]|nr:S-layer family protein [Leptolyngbya sp. SIO3F4]
MEKLACLFVRALPAFCLSSTLCFIVDATSSSPLQAQIQPDNTLGLTPSTLRNDVNAGQLLIEGGAPRGNTLFHSFSDFSIATDGNAYFANPNSIDVIVSRVTGNSPSNLLGTLGVLGEADLFFINPHGLIFGPESSLDLNGSFVASTANSVVFNNHLDFSAIAPETPPLLTFSAPVGFQFGQQPGSIDYQADRAFLSRGLKVQPGRTLALLGGDLNFEGANLEAIQGRIELGSVSSTGIVTTSSTGQGWTFNYDDVSSFGNMAATRSFIRTFDELGLLASDISDGDIVIQALDITLSLSTLILADTFTDVLGGDILVNARRLDLSGGSRIAASTATTNRDEDMRGDAGDIVINASESVTLDGGLDLGFFSASTTISTSTRNNALRDINDPRDNAFGDGGDITINTQRLSIKEGADVTASSSSGGDAGNIVINASEFLEVSGAFFGGSSFTSTNITTGTSQTGASGEILINTGQLLLQDGGRITSRTSGTRAAGNIEINADVVEISGSILPVAGDIQGEEIFSSVVARTESTGDAGLILLNARQVNLKDGGQISTATLAGSGGNGNLLQINAVEGIQIEGVSKVEGEPSGLFSSTEGSGSAGEVQVEAESLSIFQGGEISAATLSETAEASGNLNLKVNRLFLNNGRLTVETEAQGGSGAEIAISDLDVLLLRNGSLISAEAFNNANGGNIRIEATEGFVVAPFEEDSDILARANLGNGGDIEIVAQSILGLREGFAIPGNGSNDIDASSSFGTSGTVLLNELEVNPAVEDAELADDTGTPEISQQCNASQDISSFVATGRGGVPLEPQTAVPEILWQPHNSQTQESSSLVTDIPQIVEAQGWHTTGAGQIVLTASTTETLPYATTSSMTHCSLAYSSEV